MTTLDISQFHHLDGPGLTPEERDIVRTQFSSTVTRYAATCRTNDELMDALFIALSPASGLSCPFVIGEGSTRRVWSLPFQLVLKLERVSHPRLSRQNASDLYKRRRSAMWCEWAATQALPNLFPRIYSKLFSFGAVAANPSAIIMQRMAPLVGLEDNDDDIVIDDLQISRQTGKLLILDPRFHSGPRPQLEPANLSFAAIFIDGDKVFSTANFGVDDTGQAHLLDGGNLRMGRLPMDQQTFTPTPDALAYLEAA